MEGLLDRYLSSIAATHYDMQAIDPEPPLLLSAALVSLLRVYLTLTYHVGYLRHVPKLVVAVAYEGRWETMVTGELKNGNYTDGAYETERREKKDISIEGTTKERIKSVINFLKDKIPELKFKVMENNVPDEVIEDGHSVKQFMQENDVKTQSSEDSEDEADDLDKIQLDEVALGGYSNTTKDYQNLDMKLFIDGVLHNKEYTSSKDDYVHQPAEIRDMERDSFVLHVLVRSQDHDIGENNASKVKVAAAITNLTV